MVPTEDLTILHFNDVYHISDATLVARFASVFTDPRHVTGEAAVPEHVLRIFSGDAFSPSLEASVLRGEHMPALLNSLNIDVACYGNHDFDFGDDRLVQLSKQTTFPWTLANAVRNPRSSDNDSLLAQAKEYVIQNVAGYRIGFFGLAGTDWPSNCQHLPSCDILDPVTVSKRTVRHLRQKELCDLVIALTHMRLAEDIAVSQATADQDEKIDLVLGGHDHNVIRRAPGDDDIDANITQQGVPPCESAVTDYEGDVRIVKSGTDWRGLSVVRLRVARHNDDSVSIQGVKLRQVENLKRISNYNKIPECPRVLKIISDIHSKIEKMVQRPLLMTDVPLEGRSQVVRSQEANLGNMLADAVREFYNTDIAVVNSGAIRCDRIIQAQQNTPLRIRDVVDISPFDNAFVVKRISGRILTEAFENSVSDAHLDGRFLQVSGLKVTADWSCREGQRVSSITYLPRDGSSQALVSDRMYTVAMIDFIASGFDGYSCFRDTETLVDAEGAMTDTSLLLQIFDAALSQQNDGGTVDSNTEGIRRAKKAVIRRWHPVTKLPVIGPSTEGRIQFINRANL
ncbi:2,3-cyclic-nucleotide 2-phosphodiesterase [Trichoderma compactum]